MFRRLFKKVGYVIFRIFYIIVSLISKRALIPILKIILEAFEDADNFLYLYIKPKDLNIIPKIRGLNSCDRFAIILQGPICKIDNITIDSIRYYKKMYADCDVIVSTWDDEPNKLINEIEKMVP